MKKYLLFMLTSLTLAASCQQATVNSKSSSMIHPAKSIYSFQVPSLSGGIIDFSAFKGKKILIVNTASECGYTPQYKPLQELHEKYGDKVVIIGFPCDDFGGQEPGTADDIRSFCTSKYKVSFLMAAKVRIKGDDPAPIYSWLTHKDLNGSIDAEVSWNFNKFLLDENGHLIAHFPSRISPLDPEIVDKIK
jgi:glutathione peroxidase